ncbi:cupin domain-containing protein [Acidisoma cellulosilytica]|uniref:Cupin domain-containing protein n=1 Tax=Acidisoma cellulosilyticum TaxID=2802395 RepID=A0A964E2Q2_9PROT|nr:cupin domain-containing protein [Acidisoma cellulosilyticum]MCB8879646.1 cupin domain-containing protein [Acidisoma cellulosilyticum]
MTITHLQNAIAADLGERSPVGVPLGEPVAQVACVDVERPDQVETGIWECTPGRWRRQIMEQEFCHFIAGSGTFTPDHGEPIAFKAGDAFLMPANSTGIWDIQETARKTYVLIKR